MSSLSQGTKAQHVVLFIPRFGDGGVGRTFVNLANGFAERKIGVSLVVNQRDGVFFDRLRPEVGRVIFESQTDKDLARELFGFLRHARPQVVMTGQGRDDYIAITVKEKLRDPDIRFFLRVGTSLAHRSAMKSRFQWAQWFKRRKQRRLFSHCDGVIANSQGAAQDLRNFLRDPSLEIAVLPNPTVTPDLLRLAHEPVDHPWLQDDVPPVIMGVGRLGRAKDFPTLLKAFALLRKRRVARLLILGQGRQRERLELLSQELGIAEDVCLTGFVNNPYAHLARAKLFVLSSLWEGCPNALIEALALGTPVVATDCPSGPREILADGRYGALVAPGDAEALAAAMVQTLDHPLPAASLRKAVLAYTAENSARAYLRTFGLIES